MHCIEETHKVVDTNTNLGIVLLLAPLASVPLDEPLQPGLSRVLAATTVEDSRNAFAAIRLANPGGLGKAQEQDVHYEPTLPLREVMALAKERDLVARQYANDFAEVRILCRSLGTSMPRLGSVERAIVAMQIAALATVGTDTLIRRKCGVAEAEEVRSRALAFTAQEVQTTKPGRRQFLEFDAWLRADNHRRNPGTTADLIAAALFVALRDGRLLPTCRSHGRSSVRRIIDSS